MPYSPGEIYLEVVQVGNAIKVSAIDSRTGIEVSVVGSASQPLEYVKQVAVRKLKNRLKKESE